MDSYRKRRLRALLEAKVEDKEAAALIDKFAALKKEQDRLKAQAKAIGEQIKEIKPTLERLTVELGDKILQGESVTVRLISQAGMVERPGYKDILEELTKLYVELAPIVEDLKEEYKTVYEKSASFKVLSEGVVDSFFKKAKSLLINGVNALYKIYKARLNKIGKKIDVLSKMVESM